MNTDARGIWESPIRAAGLSRQLRFSDLAWDSDGRTLLWREERSDRGVLVGQREASSPPFDITSELSVRARVGYGGGDFTVARKVAYFSSGGRLFRQPIGGGPAIPITPPGGEPASAILSPDGRSLIYVHSHGDTDQLVLANCLGAHPPVVICGAHDFYMQPCWHPSGNRAAWVVWDHPNMPWDSSDLYLGQIGTGSSPPRVESLERMVGGTSAGFSVFQPEFSPDGRYLSFLSNQSGWFNLYLIELATGKETPAFQEDAEYGRPAWIQGLRTYAWSSDSQALYLLRLKNGFTTLVRFHLETGLGPVESPLEEYGSLSQITVSSSGELALIASSPKCPARIVTLSPQGQLETRRLSSPAEPEQAYLSSPQSIGWETGPASPRAHCHGLYYPPRHPRCSRTGPPPAVIRIHGGPTSQYLVDYHAETQFLTSRGMAVLELNYRGSSGYGKAYSEALQGRWGISDVEDAHSSAHHLISQGLAHSNQLVLMGGSAGGFTLLLSLAQHPGLFRAAICRYGVSDLMTLAADTHRFEAHYLDTLVGRLPEHRERYRERSPLHWADRIQDPVALFQGAEDTVVPQSQSDRMVDSLARRGIPHLYRVYPGEGHGWRRSETIEDYYQQVELFLVKHVLSAD